MLVAGSVHKTSISLKARNRERISQEKNKSSLINRALELYFEKQAYIQEKEQEWMQKLLEDGLESLHKGEIYRLHTPGKTITTQDLDKLFDFSC